MMSLRATAEQHPGWLAAGFSILVTLLLYGASLGLPLYSDDIVFLQLNQGLSAGELFLRADIAPYYRPLSLLPWELSEAIFGGYPAWLLHGMNLLAQAINGWLLWRLARSLRPDWPELPWISAALYLTFPFSHQTIPWAAALGHLMAASGLLLTLTFTETWWQNQRPQHLALIWVSVAFACFSHENGVISAGIPGLWLLLRHSRIEPARLRADLPRLLLAGLPALVIGLLYLLIWRQIPREATEFSPSAATIQSNLAYFSQGLSYPLAQFGGWIEAHLLPEWQAALLCSGLGLGLLIGVLAMAQVREAWIGLLVYLLAMLPASLFLAPTYVVDGPRLMQTASVGGSLAWGLGLSALLHSQRRTWKRITAGGILALMLGGSLPYVLTRMALHKELAALYHEAITGERSTVLVNLPAWLAYREEVYPLGSEGITYYSAYYPFELLVQYNRGKTHPVYVFDRADISPDSPRYYAGLIGPGPLDPPREVSLAGAEVVRWTRIIEGHWYWESAEQIERPSDPDPAAFSNGIQAGLNARLDQRLVRVEIDWRTANPAVASAFLHLVCEGALAGQNDGPPMRGMRPFETWAPGESWRETRLIPLPRGQTPGQCSIRLGLVEPASGARVALESGAEFIEIELAGAEAGQHAEE